jgi:hypothetical protein
VGGIAGLEMGARRACLSVAITLTRAATPARALQPGRQGPRILLQDATERSLIDW